MKDKKTTEARKSLSLIDKLKKIFRKEIVFVGATILLLLMVVSVSTLVILRDDFSKLKDALDGIRTFDGRIVSVNDNALKPDISVEESERIVEVSMLITNTSLLDYSIVGKEISLTIGSTKFVPEGISEDTQFPFTKGIETQLSLFFVIPKDTNINQSLFEIFNGEYAYCMCVTIDTNADYYHNVLDEQSTEEEEILLPTKGEEEFNEIKKKLETYIANPVTLKKVSLKEFGYTISLPENNDITYYDSSEYNGYEGYEGPILDCRSVNKITLKSEAAKVSCKSYSINYFVQSNSGLAEVTETFDIYVNSFPESLAGILTPSSTYSEEAITMFGKPVTLKTIVDGDYGTTFTITKTPKGDVIVVYNQNYGYDASLEEITKLNHDLFIVTLESLK